MCNYLHSNSVPIPEKGIGYKIFRREGRRIGTMIYGQQYKAGPRGIIRWIHTQKGGFCFFLSYEEAKRAANDWQQAVEVCRGPLVICRIEYSLGLGKHTHHSFICNAEYEMALCRAFKIGKTLKVYKGTADGDR